MLGRLLEVRPTAGTDKTKQRYCEKSGMNGTISGIAAYLVWGGLPIFWKQLQAFDPGEIVAIRVVGSFLFNLLFILLFVRSARVQWKHLTSRDLVIFSLSGLIMIAIWVLFIWAITNGLVLASSLGYFLAPLVFVAAGALLDKESLSLEKKWAALMGLCGVVPLLFTTDWRCGSIALALALLIVAYSAVRKQAKAPALIGLSVETGVFALPAIYFLTRNTSWATTALHTKGGILLIGLVGPATLLPLLLFAWCLRSTPLSTIGFLQYISPSLHFIIAVFLYGEDFSSTMILSFMLIWSGIALLLRSSLAPLYRNSNSP